MIQPTDYVRSLLKRSPGETRHCPGLGEDPPRQQERALHSAQRRLVAGGPAGRSRCRRGIAEDVIAKITTGACISVEGELVASPGKGQAVELKARAVTVHGAADPEHYPLQKKKHTLEMLREIAHLRPRSNTFGAVFRVRNALAAAIHKFFQERGFLYVHTPVISASRRRRRGQHVPGDHARPGLGKPPPISRRISSARRTYLTVSGQLEAEIFAHGLRQRLHLRPHLPRRELEHAAPPGRVLHDRAGDGVLRPERQSGPGRGVPQEPGGAGGGRLRRRPGVPRQVVRARTAARRSTAWSNSQFRAHHLHRGHRRCCRNPAGTSSSPPSGAPTCRASTSAT